MLSLALHVVFGSGFGLGVKVASMRRHDMLTVGALNYICAAVLASVWVLARGALDAGWSGGVWGALNGVGYFVTYFFLLFAIRHQGIAATRAIGQLAILIPILASILLWGEYPTYVQLIGLVVAGASMLLLIDARKNLLGEIVHGARWRLLAFLLLSGSFRVFAKAFSVSAQPQEKAFYVWMVFVSSGAISLVMLLSRRRLPSIGELLCGAQIGACNCIQVWFLLRALEELPGVVVFPVAACGALVMTAGIAIVLLGERPTLRMYAGIAASAVAVVLLHAKAAPPS
ncbi:hypothetical protein CMK11_22520 [Candidatus Poribacteria bacterium]|nr:hypothetical protein [Candidatus Poribacteria bacterium]